MKAILEFQLPDDRDSFILAHRGLDYYWVILDLASAIRSKYKYSEEETTTWEQVQDMFFEILDQRNVRLDEVE